MKTGRLNRRTVAQFVLLAWAGSLGWLARREFGKDEAQIVAEATIRLNPESNFFGVTAGGRQIGYASVTIDTVAAGFRLSEVFALDVPDADSTRRVTRRTDVNLSRSLRVRSFSRTLSGGGLFEELTGTVEGDSLLRLAIRDGRDDGADEWTVPLVSDIVLPEVLPYRLAFGRRLEVGRTVAAHVLDLGTGSIGRVEFAATAESTFVVADSAIEQRGSNRWRPVGFDTVPAWRIEYATSSGPVVSWVDRNGGLVATEAALGVRLERSAFEIVTINYRNALEEAGPGNLAGIPGIRSLLESGVIPPGDSAADYRIDSKPVERFLLPRLAWLDGGRQAATDHGVRVGAGRPGRRDSTKSEFLGPAPSRPPTAAAIAALSHELIVAGEGPERSAARLLTGIARRVRRDPAPDAPFLPSRVLAEGRGGAEGISALFVELARAAGLEARRVSGVAVTSRGLFSHAWAELLLDGGWVAVDPTFGRMPAPASLVRIAIGTGGRAIDLVPLMGSASFTPAPVAADQ